MLKSRQEVYNILDEERNYQDKKCGGSVHDKNHSVYDWLLIMRKYLNEAENAMYNGDSTEALNSVRKITALGVATMESHDTPSRKDDNQK